MNRENQPRKQRQETIRLPVLDHEEFTKPKNIQKTTQLIRKTITHTPSQTQKKKRSPSTKTVAQTKQKPVRKKRTSTKHTSTWLQPLKKDPVTGKNRIPLPAFLQNKSKYGVKALSELFHEDKKGKRRTDFYPIYGDQPGSYQMDLVFVKPKHKGYFPCVTMIHINRKVVTAQPLKSKNSKAVARAVEKCVDTMENEYNLPVLRISTDAGKEFQGETKKMLKNRGIHLTLVQPSEGKKTRMGVIERFHRTMRKGLNMIMTEYGTTNWVEILPYIIAKYNYEKIHRSIGMTPMEMTDADERKFVEKRQKKTEDLRKMYRQERDTEYRGGKTRVRHAVIRDEAFKKDGARFSEKKYDITENPKGQRSYILKGENGPKLKKKYMPYDVLFTRK